MGSACCSSEDPTVYQDEPNTEQRNLIDKNDKDKKKKHKKRSSIPEDSMTQSDTTTDEPDTNKKTSIFEQLQDADNEALSKDDLGLDEISQNKAGTSSVIDKKDSSITEGGDTIDRKTGVTSQPSYVDAQAGINRNAHKIKDTQFSMLKFISTSPTLRDDPMFNADLTCKRLLEAFKTKVSRDRAKQVAEVLTHLSDKERVIVSDKFVGPKGEKLRAAVEDSFSGEIASSLVELVRSSSANDAYWIRSAISKFNVNSSLLTEIICTRTNEQLVSIAREYYQTFGTSLEDALTDSVSKSGKSYLNLLKKLLNLSRKESPKINNKEVQKDIKRLYTWLEETNNWEKNKTSILDLFARRSWQHITAMCDKYQKKSMYDLQVLLNKKFGNSSKTGEALQVIIHVARDRFAYFAQLLRKAMKGLGTDDGLLIRTVVSRSGIDLKEILDRFSRDFGEGKTATQWIKGDTNGIYQYILLSVCSLDTISLDRLHSIEFAEHRRKTVQGSPNLEGTDGSAGGGSVEPGTGGGNASVDGAGSDDENKDGLPSGVENWEQYLATSPTIRKDATFQASPMADYMQDCLTSKDKKKKKGNKELVIRVITKLTNDQRQELFLQYKNKYDRHLGEDIRSALGNRGKGKSLYAVLALLQTPAQNDAYSCRKALKSGDWRLLTEILCTRTNGQLSSIIREYNGSRQDQYNDLVRDVSRLCGKKSELKIIFETIIKCQRPQTLETNYELVKQDVDKLVAKKGKFNSKDKDMLATILANNSWAHIKQVADTFGAYSEKAFEVVLKDVFGNNTNSYFAAEAIYLMATNRFAFWCRLLKESMTGMNKNQQLLIRVLITRSEIDLGEISTEFSRKQEFGGGKTLKQWLVDTTKGSFQHLLLRIAGLLDDPGNDEHKGAHSEHSLETSDTGGNFLDEQNESPNDGTNLEDRDSMHSETGDYKVKIISQTSVSAFDQATQESYGTTIINPVGANSNSSGGSSGLTSNVNTIGVGIAADSVVAAINNTSAGLLEPEGDMKREEEQVDIGDMGVFMLKKMTDKTVTKLWTHIDDDGTGLIGSEEVISIMTFTAVLYAQYQKRTNGGSGNASGYTSDGGASNASGAGGGGGGSGKKLDKNKIKKHLTPLCNWIATTKMVGKYKKIGQKQFTELFGNWLQEYAKINKQ